MTGWHRHLRIWGQPEEFPLDWVSWCGVKCNAILLLSENLTQTPSPITAANWLILGVLDLQSWPLCFMSPSPKLFTYLISSFWKAERWTEKEIAHLLVHSPNACDGQGWARQKPGANNAPRWAPGTQMLELAPAAFQGAITGKLETGSRAWTEAEAGVPSSILTTVPNTHPWSISHF